MTQQPTWVEWERWKQDERDRSATRRYWTLLFLLVVGFAAIVLGIWIQPFTPTETPAFAGDLSVESSSHWINDHVSDIHYTVDQAHPMVAIVTVEVDLRNNGHPVIVPPGPDMSVEMSGFDSWIINCSPHCSLSNDQNGNDANSGTAYVHFLRTGIATASFRMEDARWGTAQNAVNAAVAFPQLTSTATKTVILHLSSPIRDGINYDWSPYPPSGFTGTGGVSWDTPIPPSAQYEGTSITPARVVSGVNSDAQGHNNDVTLLVGVLFGVGGSALVGAVQLIPDS
jgi:hypothetical protein